MNGERNDEDGRFCQIIDYCQMILFQWSLLCVYIRNLRDCYKTMYKDDSDELDKLGRKMASFYMACQSFFGSLMTSAKIEKMDEIARRGLTRHMSIVIGLQRLGFSHFERFISQSWNDGKPFSNAL